MKMKLYLIFFVIGCLGLYNPSYAGDCMGCCSLHGGVKCVGGVTQCGDGTPLSARCREKGCDACGSTKTKGSSSSYSPTTSHPSDISNGKYPVVRVIDGDTIDVQINGQIERVRLLCVNTPESVHRDRKQNVPMGKVASDYTKKRLSGKVVELEFEGRKRGNYGRLLAYVHVDDSNFNIELVKMGLSPYYTKYGMSRAYHDHFKMAERQARTEHRNLWGDPALAEKYLRLKSKWGQREQQPAAMESKGPYVASRKSQVFHISNCKWAKKIKPENRIQFVTRDKALQNGERPCRVCSP